MIHWMYMFTSSTSNNMCDVTGEYSDPLCFLLLTRRVMYTSTTYCYILCSRRDWHNLSLKTFFYYILTDIYVPSVSLYFDWILELFWQYDIFLLFSFYYRTINILFSANVSCLSWHSNDQKAIFQVVLDDHRLVKRDVSSSSDIDVTTEPTKFTTDELTDTPTTSQLQMTSTENTTPEYSSIPPTEEATVQSQTTTPEQTTSYSNVTTVMYNILSWFMTYQWIWLSIDCLT